jgi:hypothetical protein
MFEKIYAMLWATIAVIAALFLVTGNFTMMTLVAFGFVSFGMIFMGMMCVLPSTVTHQAPPKEPKVKVKTTKEKSGIFHSKHLATR